MSFHSPLTPQLHFVQNKSKNQTQKCVLSSIVLSFLARRVRFSVMTSHTSEQRVFSILICCSTLNMKTGRKQMARKGEKGLWWCWWWVFFCLAWIFTITVSRILDNEHAVVVLLLHLWRPPHWLHRAMQCSRRVLNKKRVHETNTTDCNRIVGFVVVTIINNTPNDDNDSIDELSQGFV